MFSFISFWRTAAVVLCDMSSTVYYLGAIVESEIGKAAPWFILARAAVQLRHAGRLHRKLRAVRSRRRLSHRERSARRIRGQGGGLGAALRLRAHRPDQRRLGRAVHRRSGARNDDAPLRHGDRSRHARIPQELGLGGDRHCCHDLFPASESARHSRIEQQGAQDHDRHDRDGRHHARLEHRHARHQRPDQSDALVEAGPDEKV